MPFAEALEKLYTRRRFGIRPGLERITILLDRLGNPHRLFRTVHVVGTNGKGSTSAFFSSILSAAGYRTALFSSPHLVNFSERFRINGREAANERLAPLLEAVLAKAPEETTFFEIVTALGALFFAEEGVEIAVLEAGMGGRSDATAALTGIMTILTPVSLDHCDYLGATIAEIASEKTAIAEPGTPVVCGIQDSSVMKTITEYCLKGSNPLYSHGVEFDANRTPDGILSYQGIKFNFERINPGIPGRYQTGNAALALAAAEAIELLGVTVTPQAMKTGIEEAYWPGRMEQVSENPRIILDGAHNLAGMAALVESLEDQKYSRLLVVIGMMQDKDLEAMLSLLAPHAAFIYAVTPMVERAVNSSQLAELCLAKGMTCEDSGSVAAGMEQAGLQASQEDLIIVCGSLFVVGEAKAHLAGVEFQGIRG
ncbi:MAG: bifunctional folylpolyglutamate synthase/dihydrofolate synthase [Geobacteraceae bacterium GWC2_48_7]|nr:MAG: bifunctional folylpolyglutamate synthase/dihydrofolate synthase [Geobacteraceae bacterium GWC2_48_7]